MAGELEDQVTAQENSPGEKGDGSEKGDIPENEDEVEADTDIEDVNKQSELSEDAVTLQKELAKIVVHSPTDDL